MTIEDEINSAIGRGYRLGMSIAINLVQSHAARERALSDEFKEPEVNLRHAARGQALTEIEEALREWSQKGWDRLA